MERVFVPALIGNPDVANELSIDYEMGYRSTITKNISVDLAAYYDSYSHLTTTEPGTPFFESQPAPAHIVIPIIYENLMHGETHGIEGFGSWKIADRLTLSPGLRIRANSHASGRRQPGHHFRRRRRGKQSGQFRSVPFAPGPSSRSCVGYELRILSDASRIQSCRLTPDWIPGSPGKRERGFRSASLDRIC